VRKASASDERLLIFVDDGASFELPKNGARPDCRGNCLDAHRLPRLVNSG